MKFDVHHHYHYTDPDVLRRLDGIERALNQLLGKVETMTKVTDAALAEIEASVANVTTVIDAVKAFIDANVNAQAALNAELAAEGVDVTKLQAFNDAIKANTDRLTALIVQGTPADTGTPVPPAVATTG